MGALWAMRNFPENEKPFPQTETVCGWTSLTGHKFELDGKGG